MKTKLRRYEWTCPLCETRYAIPVGHNPEKCPKCETVEQPPPIPQINLHPEFSVARRRPARTLMPATVIVAGSVLLAVFAVAVVKSGIFGESAPGRFVPDIFDEHRSQVHQWIDENANDGDWEEVRWWPAKTLSWGNVNDGKPTAICRIKWRGRSEAGGPVLHDDVFVLDDSGVRKLDPRLWNSSYIHEPFPD